MHVFRIRRGRKKAAAVAALLLAVSCAVLAPSIYSNYYIPPQRMLTEIRHEGRLPDTPRIFVQDGYLYVRPESFDLATYDQAQMDAYEDMMLIYDKITGQRKVGRYAEKAGEKIIYVRTPGGEDRVAAEILYALPLSRFSPELQEELRGRYDESAADGTKPEIKQAEPDTLLEKFRQHLYINPVLKDSLKVTRILSWHPFTGPDVCVRSVSPEHPAALCIRAYSGLADTRSRAEHAAEMDLAARLEKIAVHPVIMRTSVEGMLLVKAVDVLGREGFVMEVLFTLPLHQFPDDIRNRLKIHY